MKDTLGRRGWRTLDITAKLKRFVGRRTFRRNEAFYTAYKETHRLVKPIRGKYAP